MIKIRNMKETQASINLMQLNKRYLDLYYSVGVYEERKSIKKIISILFKYLSKGRIKELISMGQGFFSRHNNENTYKKEKIHEYEFPENIRVVVYTCIVGEYDNLKEPLYVNDDLCDFIAVTDVTAPKNSAWKCIDINSIDSIKNLSPGMKNRYVKLHPHELFADYDYSVYVDGSITVVADVMPIIGELIKQNAWLGVHNHSSNIDCIYDEAVSVIGAGKAPKDVVKKQIDAYKAEGYPKHNGLYENTILVRKHNDARCQKVMNEWWQQLNQFSQRDQMSFNYVLWKNNIQEEGVCILGNDLYRNPRFFWQPHNDYVKIKRGKANDIRKY